MPHFKSDRYSIETKFLSNAGQAEAIHGPKHGPEHGPELKEGSL